MDPQRAALKPSAQRVQDALDARGTGLVVRELPSSTRSAAEAAQAVGCSVGQIVKSLIFRGLAASQAVLVIASGANRVDLGKVTRFACEPLEKADAGFVRDKTGFAIGGVPPAFHKAPMLTLIDEQLLAFEEVWAAAGTPNAVFRLSPAELLSLTGGVTLDLAQGA
jgi:prolyl-tRNA editing enzyme YbaK/EbsC (Cys-tRNA(Pro) deacylase)